MPLSQSLKKNSHVLWSISLIQDKNPEAQTKTEFAEMANDLLATSTIDKVTICLASTLQRFRFMIEEGLSEEEAVAKCNQLSQKWFEENKEMLQKLKENKKLEVLGWDECRNWQEHPKVLQEVEAFYKENKEFKRTFDGRIGQAFDKLSPESKISNPLEQTALLKKYLFEECVYQKYCASKGFHYELYKMAASQPLRHIKKNIDFVPKGFMTEVYFTQYANEKKGNLHLVSDSDTSNSFSGVFSKENANNKNKSEKSPQGSPTKSRLKAMSEFLESTMQLVPEEKQEQVLNSLLQFTTTQILPLCYQHQIKVMQ